MIIPQNSCSTLSIITRARSLDYVPATNTGVWNVPSSRLEKMMATKKYIRFVGGSNKTYKGGLAQVQLKPKDIKHYCAEGNFPYLLQF